MDGIKRRPIPQLKSRRYRKGARNIVWRSFPAGIDDYFRCFVDEPFNVSVKFSHVNPGMRVKLHTDTHGEWKDFDFEQKSGKLFSLDLKFERSGIFRFKVKYSYNNGASWFWDNVPFTFLYVDPPNIRNLKMYTIIPSVSGNFDHWKQSLAHIKDMGFNAVHLLPVTAMDMSESPYSAFDLFSLDHAYVDPADPRDPLDQFEEFVIEAKRLGIKICVDLVLNHIGVSSKMSMARPDWLATDSNEPDSNKRAGCWHHLTWIKWEDLALIKYDHPNPSIRNDLWNYMKQYVMFWANYADYTDGLIRLDNLHSSDRKFMNYLIGELNKEFPEVSIYAELFTDQSTVARMTLDLNLNLLMATPWVASFAEQMREFFIHIHSNYKKLRYFIPLNSHDSRSVSEEYGGAGVTVARYAVCALFGTGATGLTQGSEVGVAEKVHFIGRRERLDLSPEKCGYDFSKDLKKINELLDDYPVLRCGENLSFIDQGHGAIMAAWRFELDQPERGFIVVSNLDPREEQVVTLTMELVGRFILGQTLPEVLGGVPLHVDDFMMDLKLGPGEVRVFKVG